MKRIIALLICILIVFACPMNVFAENSSDIETTTVVVRPTSPIKPQLKPEYQNINSIGLTFYVANGRAYASYTVSSQKNGISVSVKIEKKTLGILWADIGDKKQEKTENKYISGSYTVSSLPLSISVSFARRADTVSVPKEERITCSLSVTKMARVFLPPLQSMTTSAHLS